MLRLLDDVDDALLLALPALAEVVVERPGAPTVTVRDVADALARAAPPGPARRAHLLADRPTEERGAATWSLTWALPARRRRSRRGAGARRPARADAHRRAAAVARRCCWRRSRWTRPGGTSPPGRRPRRWSPHAAAAYAELLARARGRRRRRLAPAAARRAGRCASTARCGRRWRDVVPGTPLLHAAEDAGAAAAAARRRRPGAARRRRTREVVTALAPWVAGLVHAAPRRPAAVDGPRGAGARRWPTSSRRCPRSPDPARWRALYAALAPLAARPAGPRGAGRGAGAARRRPGGARRRAASCCVDAARSPGPATAAALVTLGVRTVHPDAAHPLLERLGAVPASARAVLDLPAVRAGGGAGRGGRRPRRVRTSR